MPRIFVNSMANFVIHGGMVSFTLQDQAMRTEGGQPRPGDPETVCDVVMREQDFAQLVAFFNQHIRGFEEQTGRKLGAGPEGGAPAGGEEQPRQKPASQQGTGMKIRPKGS